MEIRTAGTGQDRGRGAGRRGLRPRARRPGGDPLPGSASAVRVLGITVPSTGMVTCDGGLQLLADLFAAIETPSVPVACGVEPRGRDAVPFPEDWGAGW